MSTTAPTAAAANTTVSGLVTPPAAADTTVTPPPAQAAAAASWSDMLPEAYRGNEAIVNMGGLENLLKEYDGLKTTLATNPDQFPGFDADYNQHKEFFTKIGVPESADKYELSALKDIPPDNVDKGRLDKILAAAHANKVPQSMVDAIIKADIEHTTQKAKDIEAAITQEAQNMEQALVQKWGSSKDANIKALETVLTKFGSQEAKEVFSNNLHVFLHPAVQDMLLSIGQAATEVPSPGASSTSGGMVTTAQQATTELQRFMMDATNRAAYRNPMAPSHKQVVDYVTNLYQRGAKLND